MNDSTPSTLPDPHRAFLRGAIAVLGSDPRILGVAAGGSYLSNTMDELSDLDLIREDTASARTAGVSSSPPLL